MTEFKFDIFDSISEVSKLNFIPLSHHLWGEDYPCFFESRAGVCLIKNKGVYVVMMSDEPCPRAVYTKRDDPIYKDSCLEFFFQPFADDERYINFEINPNGAYLSEVGTQRYDRKFIAQITESEPVVKVVDTPIGWGVSLFVPEQLISDVFGKKFSTADSAYIRANFYKCGEETDYPHFSSAFFVNTPTPDFHRPEYFGKIYLS